MSSHISFRDSLLQYILMHATPSLLFFNWICYTMKNDESVKTFRVATAPKSKACRWTSSTPWPPSSTSLGRSATRWTRTGALTPRRTVPGAGSSAVWSTATLMQVSACGPGLRRDTTSWTSYRFSLLEWFWQVKKQWLCQFSTGADIALSAVV